jgi:hypothetical protein
MKTTNFNIKLLKKHTKNSKRDFSYIFEKLEEDVILNREKDTEVYVKVSSLQREAGSILRKQ